MAIVNGSLELGYKNTAWFTANPTLVLKEGQIVYLEQTGTYKIGNGSTQLSALSFLGVSSETQTLQNVTDLGNFTTNNIETAGITTDYVQLDTTATTTGAVGKLTWNDVDGTANLGLKGGNVTLQIGQEFLARVVNKTATNISLLESNYQAVRITGAIGQRPKVDLALADNDLNSATTLGLVTETIANNAEGFITTSGQVKEINTTGSLQGETWVDGDTLYLSGTVAGMITNIKPSAPIHTVIIGFVEYAHAIHGKIFVKVNNGYELEELHNVSAIAPNNNEVLTYETSSTLWKPKTVVSALGFTPYNATNPSGYITGINSSMVTTALGFTPYNSTNPSGYITGITSGMVTTALGFTPYNSTNPSGYITSSALSTYVPYTGATGNVDLGTNTLKVGNGTASATAIQLGATANLGLYSSSDNKIDFVTNGAVRMSINANGTVVMGTAATNVIGNTYLDYGTNATGVRFTATSYNLAVGSGTPGTGVNYLTVLGLVSTGASTSFTFTKPNNTNQTLSTSIAGWNYNGGTRQWATGAITTQSENIWGATTYSFVGASTITNAYGNVFNAPIAGTNATITNNYSAQFNGKVEANLGLETNTLAGLNTAGANLLIVSNNTTTKGYISIGNNSAETIYLQSQQFGFTSTVFFTPLSATGFSISRVTPSDTIPNFVMNRSDLGTGIGGTVNTISLITASTTKVKLFNNGNFTIQSGGTFTDNGFKLEVVGTGRFTNTLTLATGTTTIAPLKLTAGTNLTTPVNGSFEFDGTNLYFTVGGVRKTVTLI